MGLSGNNIGQKPGRAGCAMVGRAGVLPASRQNQFFLTGE
jgi:hypothetical protein